MLKNKKIVDIQVFNLKSFWYVGKKNKDQCAKLWQNPWTTDWAAQELLKTRAILLDGIL